MKRWYIRAATLLACALFSEGHGQTPDESDAESVSVAHAQNHSTLEAYVDGLVQAHITEHDLTGMTIAVVVGQEVAFLKGYGYANLETRDRVDPQRHLFRVGSISKTFTWVAVMQLTERGLIDLDEDINTYLEDFQIPAQFGAPITMRHLMTHTPGFEVKSFVGDRVASPDQVTSLAEYVRTLMPARIKPPGEIYIYSSYGTALAGYVVETISAVPFAFYIEDNILAPLRMANSTFREALGAEHPENVDSALWENLVQSYRKRGGRYRRTPEYYRYQNAPRGGLKTTAADMSSYMIALLGDGSANGGRILAQETTERMRERLFANAPAVSGWTYGFHDGEIGNVRTISHGGSTPEFYSMMQMAPELGVGVFLSINTNQTRAPLDIARQIIGHVAGSETRPMRLTARKDFVQRGERLVGKYLVTRRNYSRLESANRIGAEISVSVSSDGYLVTRGLGPRRAYVETGPLAFREMDGEKTLAFRENESGEISYLFTSDGAAFERIGLFRTGNFYYSIAGISLFLSLTTLLAAWSRHPEKSDKQAFRLISVAPVMAAASTLGFVGVFFMAIAQSQGAGLEYEFNWPGSLIVVGQWIAVLLAASIFGLLGGLPSAWDLLGGTNGWHFSRRLHYTALTISLTILLTLIVHWNMIGFKY